MTIRLWLIKDSTSGAARLYSKIPPERNPGPEDCVWIPRSIVEHTSKRGNEHQLVLPDWFVEKEKL
jgi:hypothetical protein